MLGFEPEKFTTFGKISVPGDMEIFAQNAILGIFDGHGYSGLKEKLLTL